jgi:hypothetical protein
MSYFGPWIKVLGAGLLAGFVAVLFMTVVLTLLRLFVGVGLPADLGGDRFLPTSGEHELVVRATDGDGEPQIEKTTGINPDGATGYHKLPVHVEA